MEDEQFDITKTAVLDFVQQLFEEIEKELAVSHQEKYALLEDAFESAVDQDELKVAFEQWYHEHEEDLDFDYELNELWDQALGNMDD
ncbi:MAG: hypothetical protein GF349_00720 [Candidatus Magasanikbacteria bacterium]|nr:hypothetical protein [Candidatus Magasanikbacteria bacterium]